MERCTHKWKDSDHTADDQHRCGLERGHAGNHVCDAEISETERCGAVSAEKESETGELPLFVRTGEKSNKTKVK